MIKLSNIVKSKSEISCLAEVEDCSSPFELIYDINDDTLNRYQLPNGYEWCESHVSHALSYLRSLKNKTDIPNEKIIMWY